MTMNTRIAYAFHRTNGFTAATSLSLARADMRQGTRRSAVYSGNVSRQQDRPDYAWIERPADCGLVAMGDASDLVRLGHEGWFTDEDFQDETLVGAVWKLRHGRGYVAGYRSSDECDLAGFVHLVTFDTIREAAFAADHLAEVAAEREREWNAASTARIRFDEMAEDIAEAHAKLMRIYNALKTGDVHPILVETANDQIKTLLTAIRDDRTERAELERSYGHHSGWEAR